MPFTGKWYNNPLKVFSTFAVEYELHELKRITRIMMFIPAPYSLLLTSYTLFLTSYSLKI